MILSKVFASAHFAGSRKIVTTLLKNGLNSKMILRHGGGGRRVMRTRQLEHAQFWPLFIRYFLIGAIPTALLITYANLFIGDAVLHDHDPEIYQPKHWEYYKHPITRWLARYCMEDPALSYYKDVYMLEVAQRDYKQHRLVRQVYELQKLEQSGMIPWQENPNMSRVFTDDITEYIEKNLKEPERE